VHAELYLPESALVIVTQIISSASPKASNQSAGFGQDVCDLSLWQAERIAWSAATFQKFQNP
jgi:hypothetical protein